MGTVGGAVVGSGRSLPSGLSVRTRDRRGCPRSPGCRGSPRSVRRGAACALSQRSLERRRSPAGVRAPSASLRRADLGPRFVAAAGAASRHLLCPSLSWASAWTVAEPAGPQLAGCACRLHGPAWIGESTAPHEGPACHTRLRSAVCLSAGLSTPAKTPRPRSVACPSWPRPRQRPPHRGLPRAITSPASHTPSPHSSRSDLFRTGETGQRPSGTTLRFLLRGNPRSLPEPRSPGEDAPSSVADFPQGPEACRAHSRRFAFVPRHQRMNQGLGGLRCARFLSHLTPPPPACSRPVGRHSPAGSDPPRFL